MDAHDVAEALARNRHDLVSCTERCHAGTDTTHDARALVAEPPSFRRLQRIRIECLEHIAKVEANRAHFALDLAVPERPRRRFHPLQIIEISRCRTVQAELGSRVTPCWKRAPRKLVERRRHDALGEASAAAIGDLALMQLRPKFAQHLPEGQSRLCWVEIDQAAFDVR